MEKQTCTRCGVIEPFTVVPVESGPHHAKLLCPGCGAFGGWAKKPENEKKRGKNKHTAESMGIYRCQMCERHESRLGEREMLTPHHVVEIQHGGEDDPSNIWIVCTACHATIHHARAYMNRHQQNTITLAALDSLMAQDNVPESVRGYMRRMLEALKNG